jgi:LysM repeat protein
MRKFGVLMIIVLLLSAILVPAATAGGYPGAGSCPPVYYRVVRGDNLARIASRYGVSIWQVARWNGIANIDRIYIGSVLVVYPARCNRPAPKPVPPPHPQPPMQPVPPIWGVPPVQPVPPIWPVPPMWPTSCPDQRAVIAAPGNGAHVWGMVTITGNAVHENFKFYKLEYGAGANPTDWHWFFGGQFPIWQGTLGALNTDILAPGTYSIKVTVVDQTSNYPPPCQVRVIVR